MAANIEATVRRVLTWALAPAPSVVLAQEELSEILLRVDSPVLAEASEVDTTRAAEVQEGAAVAVAVADTIGKGTEVHEALATLEGETD
jgi:hypothetical protein